MEIDRRTFLLVTGGGVAAPLLSGRAATGPAALRGRGIAAAITTLDLGKGCGLPESVAGFEAAFGALGIGARTIRAGGDEGAWPGGLFVVPAVTAPGPAASNLLMRRAVRGDLCLVELGFGFGDEDQCSAGRSWLQQTLGLRAGNPIGSPRVSDRLVPYVDYTWPAATKIRDFSRVIPLEGPGWTPMAWSGNSVVGLRRRLGAGSVVVLGSTIGPHLRSDDPEATAWVRALVAEAAVDQAPFDFRKGLAPTCFVPSSSVFS